MTDFYPLSVKHIEQSTDDCSIISFEVPNNLRDTFSFKQGQYLTLQATINGEEVRRSYSLCSSPMDDDWSVGIKEIPQGKFSTFANRELKVGDTLEVMPPNGRFYTEVAPSEAKNYLLFAAGSGITPIASILKTHLKAEPNASFKLFYVNKTANSIILKEELEGLKNLYLDRVEIFHFLTKEQRNIPFLNGRLNEEKMDVIFNSICSVNEVDEVFSCGPEKMILMIKDYLVSKGLDRSKIHFELFHAEGESIEIKENIQRAFKGLQSDVTVLEGGKSVNFTMEQGSNNLLDASLNNSADLPFACKGGVCCTCRAKLVEGEVKVLLNYGLEQDEIDDGYILTCQALPTSDKVVIDFDQ